MLIMDTDTTGAIFDQKVLVTVYLPVPKFFDVSLGRQQLHLGTRMMRDCLIRFVVWFAVFC